MLKSREMNNDSKSNKVQSKCNNGSQAVINVAITWAAHYSDKTNKKIHCDCLENYCPMFVTEKND